MSTQVKQSMSYPFLTHRAATVVEESVDRMIKKLGDMEHVEYVEYDEGTTLKLNNETEFSECLMGAIEEEVYLALRRHTQ